MLHNDAELHPRFTKSQPQSLATITETEMGTEAGTVKGTGTATATATATATGTATGTSKPKVESKPPPPPPPQFSPRLVLPHDKRVCLITAMSHFRPKTATPIQFYNYVREFCIMHNCSIDEAMEQSPNSWSTLSQEQRQLYNSEMHATLPIPVPKHLIYRAIQMERAGRWKISSVPAANGGATLYSMEGYSPPVKPTKMQARLRAQRPRYDNLAEFPLTRLESPRTLQRQAAAVCAPKKSVRTVTPPEQRAQRAQADKAAGSVSLTQLLSEESLKSRNGRGKTAAAAAAAAAAATATATAAAAAAASAAGTATGAPVKRLSGGASNVNTEPKATEKLTKSKSKSKKLQATLTSKKKQIPEPVAEASTGEVKKKHPSNKKSKKKPQLG